MGQSLAGGKRETPYRRQTLSYVRTRILPSTRVCDVLGRVEGEASVPRVRDPGRSSPGGRAQTPTRKCVWYTVDNAKTQNTHTHTEERKGKGLCLYSLCALFSVLCVSERPRWMDLDE